MYVYCNAVGSEVTVVTIYIHTYVHAPPARSRWCMNLSEGTYGVRSSVIYLYTQFPLKNHFS